MRPRRAYTLKRRAASQAQTRQRIVDAAVALHATLGPAATTISAIAEHAGVERLTVYRHFPDELHLLRACSGKWLADNPPPDPAAWAVLEPAEDRLRAALGDQYAYYARTQAMMANLLRDAPGIPFLADQVKAFESLLTASTARLSRGLPDSPTVRAAIRLALEFETWRSLVPRQGLSAPDAVQLMVNFILRVTPSRVC